MTAHVINIILTILNQKTQESDEAFEEIPTRKGIYSELLLHFFFLPIFILMLISSD